MKKLMLVFTVTVIGLSACKKDYTCNCTSSIKQDSTNEVVDSGTYSEEYSKVSNDDAELNCDALETSIQDEVDATVDELNFIGTASGETFTGTTNCNLD